MKTGMTQKNSTEPNAAIACQWWPDVRNGWAAVGWPNACFGFKILHNGTIFTELGGSKWPGEFSNQGAQYTTAFCALGKKDFVPWEIRDKGAARQGWDESSPAPVYWTEWNLGHQYGVVVRQTLFAHLPGGADIREGTETLYGWMRLSIHYIYPVIPPEKILGFTFKVDHPHLTMVPEYSYNPAWMPYPRALTCACPAAPSLSGGAELVEPDGCIRMAIRPQAEASAEWIPENPEQKTDGRYFYVALPIKSGAQVDFLLTIRPMPADDVHREAALGYDGALQETEAYWQGYLAQSATVFATPEPLINKVVRFGARNAMLCTWRHPRTGDEVLNLACLRYQAGWPAQSVQVSYMTWDLFGYHELADRYLEVYRRYQGGDFVPPADGLKPHPGYLYPPKMPKGDWSIGTDGWFHHHGAIMWAAAAHGLLAADQDFIGRWTGPLVKACEFVRDARRCANHRGVKGLMPPAVGTDWEAAGSCPRLQRLWIDGWMYKGLLTTIRLLQKIGHPRAAEFAAEAADYKAVFVKALRTRAKEYPKWKSADGRTWQFVPPAMSFDEPFECRWEIYLDCGPLFLVFAELMEADDPWMEGTRRWFREGPWWSYPMNVDSYFHAPVLHHEMGTGEAAFSWNIMHSLKLNDRRRYLEGMYSLAAGSLSRQSFWSVEERHNMRGLNLNLQCYALRLAVIEEENDTLHLMKMMPLAWLSPEREVIFDKMPTEFGPVSLRAGLSRDRQTLKVQFKPQFREAPRRTLLHIPPVPGLKKIVSNGQPLKWNGRATNVLVTM